ncbi:MAG: hypothetical protein ABIG63_11905 [Chloroflexota bacterium]
MTETTERLVGIGQRRLPSFDFVTREMMNTSAALNEVKVLVR